MHNNYYFLRQLSETLTKLLSGYTLVSCFSQSKDELILEWNNGLQSFFIRAQMLSNFSALSFPHTIHRARKNSVDLFNTFLMKKFKGIRQFRNERSFAIQLEEDHLMIFKMHGTRSNIIGLALGQTTELFRNHLLQDLELHPDQLDRDIDFSRQAFDLNQMSLQKLYVTFGRPVWDYLESKGLNEGSLDLRWNLLQETIALLEHPRYYLTDADARTTLSLLPPQKVRQTFDDPLEALNTFVGIHWSESGITTERVRLVSSLEGKIEQTKSAMKKAEQRLHTLKTDAHYQQWADIIMANLTSIPTGSAHVTLDNFYHAGTKAEIPLKKELSAQKNAEAYYRKSKNSSIEAGTLEKFLNQKETEITKWTGMRQMAMDADQLTTLKELSAKLIVNTQKGEKSLPYHEFNFKGFSIWVGKNAATNDELTLKHSFKEDLWLHAKDVAGSHVLVKYQSGKPFPKDVIEQAARLAAWHSKRKNESLCPVAYTPKKFVRKRKGDPAGSVVVEKEKVILVEPAVL